MHCIHMQFDGKMTYNRDVAIISESMLFVNYYTF